jgi:hypothetical protein
MSAKVKTSSASVHGQVSPWCGQPAELGRKSHTQGIKSPQAQFPGQKAEHMHPALQSTKPSKGK